jgi:hypothetical protein
LAASVLERPLLSATAPIRSFLFIKKPPHMFCLVAVNRFPTFESKERE